MDHVIQELGIVQIVMQYKEKAQIYCGRWVILCICLNSLLLNIIHDFEGALFIYDTTQ